MSKRMNTVADFQTSFEPNTVSSMALRKVKTNICGIIGDQIGQVYLYSPTQPSQPILTLSDPNATVVTSLEYLEGTCSLLTGNARGMITMLDLDSGKQCANFSKHTTTVKSIKVFQSQPNCFVSGSLDTSIRIWDVRQRMEIACLKGHSKQVNEVSLSPYDAMLISASDDGSAKVWNLGTNKLVGDFWTDKRMPVFAACFHPNQFQAVFGGSERSVSFYSTESYSYQANSKEMPSSVGALAFDDTGSALYVAGNGYMRAIRLPEVANFEIIDVPWKKTPQLLLEGKDLFALSLHSRSVKITKLGINLDKTDPEKPKRIQTTAMQIEPMPKQQPIVPPPIDPEQEQNEIEELQKGHVQIMYALQTKYNSLLPIVAAFYEQHDLRASAILIEKLNDDKAISDVLKMFMNTGSLKSIPIDFATLLIKKASIIFDNKYKVCLKVSLKFTLEAIRQFSKDIVSVKNFPQLAQYDVERDERIKRYDAFLAEIDGLVKKKFFGKIITTLQQEEIGMLAQSVMNDYQFILTSVKK